MLGNVRDHNGNFLAVWQSETARRQRQFIIDRKCHCTYECVMSTNILFNMRSYPQLFGEMIRGR